MGLNSSKNKEASIFKNKAKEKWIIDDVNEFYDEYLKSNIQALADKGKFCIDITKYSIEYDYIYYNKSKVYNMLRKKGFRIVNLEGYTIYWGQSH